MKKNILKFTLVVAALAIAGYGGVKAYNTYANCDNPKNLFLQNVEALAEETNESMDNYYLHHHSCKVTATAALAIIFKVKVGATIDLTDMTQFYNHVEAGGEGPCQKGTDKTCNDAVNSVLHGA